MYNAVGKVCIIMSILSAKCVLYCQFVQQEVYYTNDIIYHLGGACEVPLEVLLLILGYYLRLAVSTDSYLQVFFVSLLQ